MRRYLPNLNAATEEELERIPGISEEIARKLVQFRDEIGGIHDFDELLGIDGITQAHVDHLRPWLRIEQDRDGA